MLYVIFLSVEINSFEIFVLLNFCVVANDYSLSGHTKEILVIFMVESDMHVHDS